MNTKRLFGITGLLTIVVATGMGCSSTQKAACSGDVICTMMFASVSVSVKDIADNPVTLDSTVTVREDKADRFVPESNGGPDAGNYVVLDDSYLSKLKNQTGQFRLKGYRNGSLVVDEPYTISADCCHVSLQKGSKQLVVQ